MNLVLVTFTHFTNSKKFLKDFGAQQFKLHILQSTENWIENIILTRGFVFIFYKDRLYL